MTLDELDQAAKQAYDNKDYVTTLELYAKVFTHFPLLSIAYNNYGNIIRELGFPLPAIGFLETAVKLDPNDIVAPLNLALAYLAAGEMEKGWKQFEARWKFRNHQNILETFSDKPIWYGEDITGKTLIVACEEGDGDNIQFCRYTKQLTDMGINVILQTETNIVNLYKANFDVPIIDNKVPLPPHDYWIPILNLPIALNVNYSNVSSKPYIKAPKELKKTWKNIVGEKTKPLIGFSYRGRTKSFPYEKMLQFVKAHPEYQFVSIQTGCTPEELVELQNAPVIGYFDYINDWYDTCGLLSQLDAVVCVDTGLGHLAGAMGTPCYILLDKYKVCWRWLTERDDTPWYKNTTLVRQEVEGDYDNQLLKLASILETKFKQ